MTVTTYESGRGIVAVAPPGTAPEPPPPPPVEPVPPGEPPGEPEPDESEPAEPSETSASAEAPRGRGGFQERIKTLVGQRNALREESTAKDARIAQLEHQLRLSATPSSSSQPVGASPSRPSPLVVPRQEDFPTPEAWGQALEQYWRAMAGEEAKTIVTQLLQDRDTQAAQQMRRGVVAAWQTRMEEGQALYDDFDVAWKVLPRYVPDDLYPVIEKVVIEEPEGAKLFYHLVTHAPAMQELARYRPGAGAETYLRGLVAKPANGHAPARPTPPAPVGVPPVQPLTGSGPVPGVGETPAEVAARGGTLAEYEAAKARQQDRGR